MRFSDSRHHGYDRRGEQDRQGGGRRPYHDPNRMNEETFGSTAVREQREQYNKGEFFMTSVEAEKRMTHSPSHAKHSLFMR